MTLKVTAAAKKKLAKAKTAPKKQAKTPRQAQKGTPQHAPDVVLRVLEGELKAVRSIGLLPEPSSVRAWFPTASTQLRKFIGESAAVVTAFEAAIQEALTHSEGYDRRQSGASDIRRALGEGVVHAGEILSNYVRAFRDEAGLR